MQRELSRLRTLSVFLLAALCILASSRIEAGVIFSQTQTGAQLNSNGSVTFPNSPANTSNPTVSGSSLDFINTTNSTFSVLMRWDLLSAAARGDLSINMSVDYQIPGGPTDNDPIFAIQAGSNFLGVLRSDNSSGQAFASRGSINTTVASGVTNTSMITGLDSIDSMSWTLTIPDAAAGPQQVSDFVEASQSAAGPFSFTTNLLNSDDALSFVLIGNTVNFGGTEQYRINSVSVSIDDSSSTAIPEPSSLTLLAIGAIGLIGRGWRRKRIRGSDSHSHQDS